jgi:hypothetical protein
MKYTVDMGSGAVVYVCTKFNIDWFRHSKVDVRETDTQHDLISLLFLSKYGSLRQTL